MRQTRASFTSLLIRWLARGVRLGLLGRTAGDLGDNGQYGAHEVLSSIDTAEKSIMWHSKIAVRAACSWKVAVSSPRSSRTVLQS